MVGENKMSQNGLGRLILCMSSRIGEFSDELVHPVFDTCILEFGLISRRSGAKSVQNGLVAEGF
jgi:hypothetical protein